MKTAIGVIGCGNMGQALMRGMLRARLVSPAQLAVADADPAKLRSVARAMRVQVCSNTEAAHADVVLLAVKPQQTDGLLAEIRPLLCPSGLVVSIAAGIPTAWIESRLNPRAAVVRVMPNTPALIGAGVSAVAPGRRAGAKHLKAVHRIFSSVGSVVQVPERWMDAVTALSGSGPAYFFFLMERMIETGVSLGLSRKVAAALVLQTASGAARLAAESGEDPAMLRARVTSKRGTTEAAFAAFAKFRLAEGLSEGIRAAARRSKELARELGG